MHRIMSGDREATSAGSASVVAGSHASFLEWLRLTCSETGDVTLKDGVKAHSLVLDWRSLSDLPRISTSLRIEVVKAILKWAYLGELVSTSSVDTVCEVYKAATELSHDELTRVSTACLEQMMAREPSRAAVVLKFSDSRDLPDLAESCVRFLGVEDNSIANLSDLLRDCTPRRAADILLRRLGGSSSPSSAWKDEFGINIWPALCEASLHIRDDAVFTKVVQALEAIAGGSSSSALMLACEHGNAQLVERLLLTGSDCCAQQEDANGGSTPLQAAVSDSSVPDTVRVECVRLLVAKGALVSNSSCLHLAASTNAPACVLELVRNAGGDISARSASTGRTPIHEAAASGGLEALVVLLDFASESHLVLRDTVFGSTALHLAAQNGHGQCLEAILRRFPLAVNVPDYSGRTALHRACGYAADAFASEFRILRDPETPIRILLAHDADPCLATTEARTMPLHWLCGGGGAQSIAQPPIVLRKETVDTNDGHKKCVRLLVKDTAGKTTIHSRAMDGSTPLHTCIRFGFPAAAQELVVSGAMVNVLDNANTSPLMLARSAWPLELVARVLVIPLPPPEGLGEDTDKCERCFADFTFFLRRHHCRNCAACVCGPCSTRSLRLSKFQQHHHLGRLHRVCDLCFDCLVIVHHEQVSTPPVIKVRPKLFNVDG